MLGLAGAALSQSPQDFVQSLVNQKLILRHVGDQEHAKVKKNKLADLKGPCDIAVEVTKASWEGKRARFLLANIGTPYVPGKPGARCRQATNGVTLEISGFASDETQESVAASVAQILQTPEQYLASYGISSNLPLGPDDEVVSKSPPQLTPPKSLLSVDPAYSEDARKAKFGGTVALSVVVGTDGRIHHPAVTRALGYNLDENVLRALPLWRFEPARQLDKPVATKTSLEVSFHLY